MTKTGLAITDEAPAPAPAPAEAAAASHWAVVRGAQDLWRRLRADARTIPAGAWWGWAGILVGGMLLCAALSVTMTLLARGQREYGLQAWDERWLQWVEQHGPMKFPDAVLAESPGNLAYLIPLTLVAAIIAIRRHRPLVAFTVLVAYWGVRPIVLAGWMTWDRARPTLIADGVAAPGLHAFPSGHAALSVAVYGFLAYLWVRASGSRVERVIAVALAAAWVAMISLARVRLGSHWPSDVLAGATIGSAWLAVVIMAFRRAERRSRGQQT
jgi:membrane-associated phospholipid phosphatase